MIRKALAEASSRRGATSMGREAWARTAASGAVRRWFDSAQRVSFRSASRSHHRAAPAGNPDAPAIFPAPTLGAHASSIELQRSLRHWMRLESSWRRLAQVGAGAGARGEGEGATFGSWRSRSRTGAGKALGREAGVRGKHTQWEQQVMPQEADRVLTDQAPPVTAAGPDLRSVGHLSSSFASAQGVNGSESAATTLMVDKSFLERASMKQITSLMAQSPALWCPPDLIPVLLRRIATLNPPGANIPNAPSAARNRASPETGMLVRALLEHARQHLGSFDALLVSDILIGVGRLMHVHGMRLWFSTGGASGMGARALLVLANQAHCLPPAHVARVLGALGLLETGELGMTTLDHGLARRAREVISEWDTFELLEALNGLDRLLSAAKGVTGQSQVRKGPGTSTHTLVDLKRAVVEGCAVSLETMTLDQLCAFLEGAAHELQHVGGGPRVTALVAVALQGAGGGGGEEVRERVGVTRQQLVRNLRAFAKC